MTKDHCIRKTSIHSMMNFKLLFFKSDSLRILKNFFVCCPLWKSLTWQDVPSGTKTPLRAFKRNYAHKLHRYAAKSGRAAKPKGGKKFPFIEKQWLCLLWFTYIPGDSTCFYVSAQQLTQYYHVCRFCKKNGVFFPSLAQINHLSFDLMLNHCKASFFQKLILLPHHALKIRAGLRHH